MSGIDDCASQEIEASTSSNSTKNSKKCTFVQSILRTDDSQTVCSPDLRIVLPAERVPRLPQLEKRDFIQNWIIAHSKPANSPEKSYPGSPVLGISPANRSPQSPILGYRWKRVKREAGSKENCRVSLSKKFQRSRPQDSPATTRIKIERENSQLSEPRKCDFLVEDSDKTLISTSSPVLNGITNSPTLNASRVSRRKSWLDRTKIPGEFDADSTFKCAAVRRSLVREDSKVPEALSLSSPLCARNKRLKIENTSDEPGRSIENLSKRSPRFSEILVEDSPFDAEIISSSSKIPETPSMMSMIIDDYEGLKVDSRDRNCLEGDAYIVKSEHFSFSPLNLRIETSSNHNRRSQDRESTIISDSLSIVSPLGKNKKISSSLRATNTYVKSEAVEISQGFGCLRQTRESLQLPDTLSVSSQLIDDLVPESSSSANHSLCSSLEINATSRVKSANISGIKATNSPKNLKTFIKSPKCVDRLTKIRESPRLSKNSSERIDFDSNALEDEIKVESDSDATISDFIENPESQSFAASKHSSRIAEGARPADDVERLRKPSEDSCDSDETHYSDGSSIARLPIPEGDPKNSQQISQTTSNSHEGRVSANRSENRISQAASPMRNDNPERPAKVTTLITTNNSSLLNNNKKKKKAKKGSLVAKLQTIINSQVSNLRIWRYQMSRPDFRNSNAQFVTLRVRERETRFGRHYLLASVIEDSHNLLKSLLDSTSEKSESSEKITILTLVMIPEIIGVVKIRPESGLKIYPPWEIMDPAKKILNVMFFNIITTEEANVTRGVTAVREKTRIIKDFDCPCIKAEKLVDSCPVKFTNTKPSVMQAMFGS